MQPWYDEADFPVERRPVVRTLAQFHGAVADGRIPGGVVTAAGPDYAKSQAVFYIPEEDEAFRQAVAAVLDAGTYRIEVRKVYGGVSTG